MMMMMMMMMLMMKNVCANEYEALFRKNVSLQIAQFCICLLFKLERDCNLVRIELKHSIRKAETTAWGREVRPEHFCLHL